jgi:hypothetical protein
VVGMPFVFSTNRLYGSGKLSAGQKMRIDPNPLFRKSIAPWYDSNAACWILLVALMGVAVFSVAGLVVARSQPHYHHHTWVPATLLALSLFAVGSIVYRLIKRHYDRHIQDREL